MRMLRVALVLFVLASFVAATAAVSMAATVTPAARPTAKAAVNKTATMMPTKKPTKMIDLTQMKMNIDGIYKKLKTGVGMKGANNTTKTRPATAAAATAVPSPKATARASPTVMPAANATAKPTMTKPSMMLTTPEMRAIPPMAMDHVGLMSATKAKTLSAPGENLVISVNP